MREPAFWWRKAGLASGLLAPVAACYGAIAARRMAKSGAHAGVPVVCVGNFTHGGAGKTPTAMYLAKMLEYAGEKPFCLSRGYGGSLAGPQRVDAQVDGAAKVRRELLTGLRQQALQHRLRRGIGLLPIDAPVFELLERDRHAGHRAAHKGARPRDAEIAIEVFHLRLAVHRRGAIVAIEQRQPPVRL